MENRLEAVHADATRMPETTPLAQLVVEIQQTIPLEGKLHPAIQRIVEYDRVNRSDLLHTLEVYLEHNCNAQKCGKLLYLHRNSLVYRIHRIQEIGPCDLSDPEDCSYLRLSLLLLKRF